MRMTLNLYSWGVMPTPFHPFPKVYLLPESEQIRIEMRRYSTWVANYATGSLDCWSPPGVHKDYPLHFKRSVPLPQRLMYKRGKGVLNLAEPTPDVWDRNYRKHLKVWLTGRARSDSLFYTCYQTEERWIKLDFVSFPGQFTRHHMKLCCSAQQFNFHRMTNSQAACKNPFSGEAPITYTELLGMLLVHAKQWEEQLGLAPILHTDARHPRRQLGVLAVRDESPATTTPCRSMWELECERIPSRNAVPPDQYKMDSVVSYQARLTSRYVNEMALKKALRRAWAELYRFQQWHTFLPRNRKAPRTASFLTHKPWEGPAHDGELHFIIDDETPDMEEDKRGPPVQGLPRPLRLKDTHRGVAALQPLPYRRLADSQPIHRQFFHIDMEVSREEMQRLRAMHSRPEGQH